ncbi:2Fe-2S iron-sulfur cluster-binding protein [Brevundimonas sp.]|uniref:2Fe-2S iron-sulfur cluster-binding protein n=1 Tax=Brevundimonas sp. TaxID=1871086 RepID=UPI003D12A83F
MTTLTVILRTGEERAIEAKTGVSAMETIRDGGIDEIMAICGGCCSCATCHVYVAEEDWGRLSPPGPDEAGLLEFSEHPTPFSRLSCQIKMSPALDGLKVTIAPED